MDAQGGHAILSAVLLRRRCSWVAAALAAVLAGLSACGENSEPAGDRSTSATAGRGACEAAPAFSGSRLMTLDEGGTQRRYFLHLPPESAKGRRLPLVLGLHGTGGKAGFFEGQSGLSKVADEEGFVTVFPYALGSPSRWTLPGQSGPDDEAFVRDLIAAVRGQACIDVQNIAAFGHSNGGGFAVALACSSKVDLAAAVSASGAYSAQERCATEPAPPLLELHVDADPVVPYALERAFLDTYATWAGCDPRPTRGPGPDGSVRERWRGCDPGAALEHLRRPGADHDLPGSAAPAAWAFIAAHARG